jgi:hypothetical protein
VDRDEDNPQNPARGEAPPRWRRASSPAGARGAMDGANAAERSPLLAEWRRRVTTAGRASQLEIPRVALQGG